MIQSALATLRMAIGVSLLSIPKQVAALCLIPYVPQAAIVARMTGARDFAVGSLLLYACRRNHRATVDKGLKPPGENAPLLRDVRQSPEDGWSNTQLALIAGMIVDGIDVLSVLVCYLEGTMPIQGVGTIGGGAALFLGVGVYCWYRELGRDR